MDIISVNRGVEPPTPAPAQAASHGVENRELIQAVRALNSTEMFGHDNELMFQRDRRTQRMVIQVVNRETHEVISQIPPEYVLRLARNDSGGSF
jgi:uncharacterized FlaG/YvyC family protein